MMDWVRKEKNKIAEKDAFEDEIRDEPMEMVEWRGRTGWPG